MFGVTGSLQRVYDFLLLNINMINTVSPTI